MSSKKILISADFSSKSPTVLVTSRSRNAIRDHQNPKSSISKDYLCPPLHRKHLPQTSNLVAKLRSSPNRKLQEFSAMVQDSGNSARSDCETETIVIKGNKKITVSSQLSTLVLQLLSIYPTCPVIQDSFLSTSGVYRYLFDRDLNLVQTITEILERPSLVIISCRHKIPDGSLNTSRTKEKFEIAESKSCNMINMYASVMESKIQRKTSYKTPLYILKMIGSQAKVSNQNIQGCGERREHRVSSNHIFAYSYGKKVKEGAAGFRKPQLLFEKSQSCIRNVESPSKSPHQRSSGSVSRLNFK